MHVVWFFVTWLIGFVAGLLFLIQPMIVVFFGLPFSFKLKSRGIMRGNGPILTYTMSAIFLPCIFAAITYGIHVWRPQQMIGYWIGVGVTLLTGLGRIGANPTNVQEYVETNADCLDVDRLADEMGIHIPKKGQ